MSATGTPIGAAVRFVDERFGQAPFLKKTLRYVFPEHWSFLLGEIALYSFVVLVGTGVYLTFFYEPSVTDTIYRGAYEPLQGRTMSEAYRSVVGISFDVDAGLLIRQTHHWAANVFVVAIVLHLMRVFFTGAFRKPRDMTYYVGLTMLMLAILEGFLGYSLIDDLLSGMGLAIANGVALSIPVVGGNLALLVWGGEYPGSEDFFSRIYIAHVLLIPVAIGILISIHLALVALAHHSQFREPGKTARTVVGAPMWPGYALRSIGLMLAVTGSLFLAGGLIQINPIWIWGPYETWLSTNGAQPDWYMGWLIGALRLMPPFEPTFGEFTAVPNAFWGGVLFPLLAFAFLFAYPSLERRMRKDRGYHHLLERPRDAPVRTGIGVAFGSAIAIVLLFGASDRLYLQSGLPYDVQLWAFRAAFVLLPPVLFWFTKRICEELREHDLHPVAGEEEKPTQGPELAEAEREGN